MRIIANEHFWFNFGANKDGHNTSSLLSAKRLKGLLQFKSQRLANLVKPKLTSTLP